MPHVRQSAWCMTMSIDHVTTSPSGNQYSKLKQSYANHHQSHKLYISAAAIVF